MCSCLDYVVRIMVCLFDVFMLREFDIHVRSMLVLVLVSLLKMKLKITKLYEITKLNEITKLYQITKFKNLLQCTDTITKLHDTNHMIEPSA